MSTFTIPGKPQPKQRARVLRNGRTYTPKPTKDYEALVRQYALLARVPTLDGPVLVDILIVLPRPQRLDKPKHPNGLIFAPVRPDADNVRKAVLDALNGLAYHDDGQVCDGRTIKAYAEKDGEARVQVWVRKADACISIERVVVRAFGGEA